MYEELKVDSFIDYLIENVDDFIDDGKTVMILCDNTYTSMIISEFYNPMEFKDYYIELTNFEYSIYLTTMMPEGVFITENALTPKMQMKQAETDVLIVCGHATSTTMNSIEAEKYIFVSEKKEEFKLSKNDRNISWFDPESMS